MKLVITLCLVLLVAIAAQSQKRTFIRIFDEAGKKTHKGYLMAVSDSSVTVSLGEKVFEIPANQIVLIKLKRSFGHSILISSIVGASLFAIIGAASASGSSNALFSFQIFSAGELAAAGFLEGLGIGSITGSIISALQKRPVYKVNGDLNWMKVKEELKSHLPINKE